MLGNFLPRVIHHHLQTTPGISVPDREEGCDCYPVTGIPILSVIVHVGTLPGNLTWHPFLGVGFTNRRR